MTVVMKVQEDLKEDLQDAKGYAQSGPPVRLFIVEDSARHAAPHQATMRLIPFPPSASLIHDRSPTCSCIGLVRLLDLFVRFITTSQDKLRHLHRFCFTSYLFFFVVFDFGT